jgi:hypothetical protein
MDGVLEDEQRLERERGSDPLFVCRELTGRALDARVNDQVSFGCKVLQREERHVDIGNHARPATVFSRDVFQPGLLIKCADRASRRHAR